MKKFLLFLTLFLSAVGIAQAAEKTDVIIASNLQFESGSESYRNFSYTSSTSGAVYAGNALASNRTNIQINATSSGFYVKNSPGTLKSIEVETTNASNSKKSLIVYANTSVYSSISTAGTNVGSITGGGTLTIDDKTVADGFVSKSYVAFSIKGPGNAYYISKITVVWDDGSGSGSGSEEPTDPNATYASIDFTKQGYTNAQDMTTESISIGTMSASFSQNGGGNPPKYYTSGTAIRMYASNKVTISAPEGYYFTKIEFTGSDTSYGLNNFTIADEPANGTYTAANNKGEWVCGTSEPTSVSFKVTENNRVYLQTITVHYAALSNKKDAGLAYVETEVSKKMGYETIIFTNPLTNDNGLTVTYATEPINSSVATVDANGQVTVKAAGTVKIVASFAGDETYKAGSASYTLTVTDDKKYDTFNASALSFVGESGYRNFTYTGASGAIYGGFADANESTLMIHNQASGNSGVFVSQAPEGYKLGSVTVFSTTGDNLTLYANNKPYSSVSTDGKEIGNFGDGEQVALNLSGFQSNMTLYGLVPTTFCIFGNSSASSVTEIKVVWEPDTRADAGIAFAEAAVSKAFSDESFTFTNTLTNTNSLAVTYSTDPAESEVATVDANSGEVTVKAAGTVTIVATSAETADYKPASTTFTITVREPIDQVANFSLVKDINDLHVGDIIVIACPEKTKVMSTEVNSTYRPSVITTFSDDNSTLTTPADGLQLQVEKSDDGCWLFRTTNYLGTNGYLSSNTTTKQCIISETVTDYTKAKITLSETGVATILFNKGTESTTSPTIWLTYNSINNKTNEGRFSCYASNFNGANDIFIYKFESNQQTIVGEELTEVNMNEGHGPNTLSGMSIFNTNSTATEFVVKMNDVAITSADVAKEGNNITVSLAGLPYLPGAEFTIAPVVNGVEGHSEALGIQMPALPTFNVTDSKASLTYDGKEAEAGTCNIDVLVKLYITSTAGEGAKPFNYYFDIENKSGFVNHAWDWLSDDKGDGITYIVEDYLTVTTQKQGESENAIWTPVLPTEASSYTTLEFDVKPYFAFYVTPELASLITEATPAPMAAPARAGEGFVLQNVYSTQVFDQQFNFSASSEVSGVEGVTVDGGAAVEYFNLQGVRVDGDLAPGIYIRRQGQSVSKIQIR